ncbi:TlpA family protein disulfide reductase [Bacterioplanoides sp.]|uniref:TlpA family protein disulfide reductase n=1 Tax=Bacterioplanoides sp. TaxID=2066072 RepID=UPI003B5A9937
MKKIKHLVATLAALTMLSLPVSALEIGDSLPESIRAQVAPEPGKVYVIDFFAQWCVSCRIELPLVNKFHNSYKGSDKVAVVGVDVDEDEAVAKAFQKQLGIEFRVINDTESELIEIFEPLGMPALYYIRDGVILGQHLGAIDYIDEVIEADLAGLGVEL